MTEPTSAVPPPFPSGAASAAPAGPWAVLRPFVAAACLIVALGTPLEEAWQSVAVAAAAVGLLVCLWPPAHASAGVAGRVPLAVGGALALLAPFAYTNPWFGIDGSEWPWEYWIGSRMWTHRVDLALWVLTGALCLYAGLSRRRWPVALALCALLPAAARGFAERGALSLVRMERVNLLWTLAAGALGGALLHLASAREAGRGAARAVIVGAVTTIVMVYASWFPEDGERSSLAHYAADLPPIFDAAFGRGELDPRFVARLTQQAWLVGMPVVCQAACLLLALLVAAVPSRFRGRPVRFVAACAILAMIATWLVPARATLWFLRDTGSGLLETRYAQAIGEVLMKAGLCVFLLLSGAMAALLGRPRGGAAPAPEPAVASAGARWPYVVAAAVGALVMWGAFHPTYGIETRGSVLEALAAGHWNVTMVRVVCRGAIVLAALVALASPPGRVRGALAISVGAAALAALTPSTERWFGLETYVVGAATAVAVGAARVPGSRGARAAAAVAAVVALLALLYPKAVPTETRGDGVLLIPFQTALLDDTLIPLVDVLRVETNVTFLDVLTAPGRLATLGVALAALLALVTAATGARWAGKAALAAFLALGIVAPVVAQVAGQGGGGAPADAGEAMLRTFEVLMTWSVPTLLLVVPAVTDLLRPRGVRSEPVPQGV